MKYLLLCLSILFAQQAFCQDDSSTKPHDLNAIAGTWQIDLRPSPNATPYLKDFVIQPQQDQDFSGVFYDTQFQNGKFNLAWDKIYFAFSTRDRNNAYYHSGYILDGKIYGITYSPDRDFTMPWNGLKKQD